MNDKSILLIDDDEEMGKLLTDYLGREGFQVTHSMNGLQGLALAQAGTHRLILLDVMLPDLDGLEILRELRRAATVPIIMITAKGEEVERIVGLEMGADDYLPKPFSPRELVARIKAVLRRADAAPRGGDAASVPDWIHAGRLSLNIAGYRAELAGSELELTTIEFELLRELMIAAGRVLSRDVLLDRVRGRELDLFDRSIDVHISHLRQKLGDDPTEPTFIKTVRGVGYTFIEQIIRNTPE